MNLSTANENFRQLVGHNVTYSIPPFQRDYSWSEENWEELWFDIMAMYSEDDESEVEHYMGYLVLQGSENKKFTSVIDGQQRITTISIIILSALNHLRILISKGIDSENNIRREKVLRESYIGYIDPITLKSKSKLTLNKHNDRFYQTYIAAISAQMTDATCPPVGPVISTLQGYPAIFLVMRCLHASLAFHMVLPTPRPPAIAMNLYRSAMRHNSNCCLVGYPNTSACMASIWNDRE